jgi:hypothetical protein
MKLAQRLHGEHIPVGQISAEGLTSAVRAHTTHAKGVA